MNGLSVIILAFLELRQEYIQFQRNLKMEVMNVITLIVIQKLEIVIISVMIYLVYMMKLLIII